MKLKDQIYNDKITLKSAHEEYLIALHKYERIKFPIKKQHQKILDKFQTTINKSIADDHYCSCFSPKYYDDAWFTDDGIGMRIDADHPNDIRDSDWTWDEVEEILV